VFSKLTNHLAKRPLFCNRKSKIPRPPWSLGWHRIFHLASRYLRLSDVIFY
jgi:hypothetical protein